MAVQSDSYVSVGRLQDFPAGRGYVVRVARKPVALFNLDGQLYAVNNICPHLGGPIAAGEVQGAEVICPYHGMRFNIENGQSGDSFGHHLETYEVKVEDGEVFVLAWWGKAARA